MESQKIEMKFLFDIVDLYRRKFCDCHNILVDFFYVIWSPGNLHIKWKGKTFKPIEPPDEDMQLLLCQKLKLFAPNAQ